MSGKNIVQRADFHLKIVQEISDIINKSTGLNTILRRVVNKIASSLHFDVVSIYIWDNEKEKLILRATKGLHVDPGRDPITLNPNEGLTGLVYETARPITAMPASRHPRYKYFPEIGEEEYESYIGIPIILQNRCIGVLVAQTKEKRLINPAEETLFQIISSRLAGLLEVADRLERLKSPSVRQHKTRTYQGKGVSSGYAIGNVFLFRGLFQQVDADALSTTDTEQEAKRVLESIANVERDLEDLIKTLDREAILSKAEIDIFRAHLLILQGATFRDAILEKLKDDDIPAELAIVGAIEEIAEQFEGLSDRYLREKAQDFRDIGERILQDLMRSQKTEPNQPEPVDGSILVAYEIGPSFVSMLFKHKVSAVLMEQGGETSHAIIIAKSLGIPAVVGIDNICNQVRPGEKLIIDGKTGFVFTNPDEKLVEEYETNYERFEKVKQDIVSEGQESTESKSIGIKLTANIGFPIDIDLARQFHMEDVGLFRTEFAFAQYNKWPRVRQQVKIYKELASNFSGYVTVRTLDIGADKLLPYLDFPKEDNPLLGLRAIRFSMEHLDLFRDQIRAILLATKKGCRFRIMLPMVTNIWEVETAKELVDEIAKEIGLSKRDIPKLGIMMEVPAILYQLEDYKKLIDFVSVGTNDLIQYILAVDRNSNMVGHLYSGFHPSVLRMLDDIRVETEAEGLELSVCGELAGTPAGALVLIALGYKQLSVSPSHAPVIRYMCKKLSRKLLNTIAKDILVENKQSDIKRYLIDVLDSLDPSLLEIE